MNRIKNAAINWALALLIVATFAAMQQRDLGPSDHATEQAQAEDLQAAIEAEAQQARFDRAAAQICGNAGWRQQPDGAVHCVPRKGTGKTGAVITLAQVQP